MTTREYRALCWGVFLIGIGMILLVKGCTAEAGQLDATWEAPTTNTDGSQLTDLSLYRVYWSTATPCPGPVFLVKPSPTTTPQPGATLIQHLPGLTQDTIYNVSVTAVDLIGNESGCSVASSKAARPNPPTAPTSIIFR